MIHEFRRYKIKVTGYTEYIENFEKYALPIIQKYQHILGFWTSDTGDLCHVHHLWAFESLDRRVERYAAMRADPAWYGDFVPRVGHLVESMHSILLTPVGFHADLPLGQQRIEWKQW